MTKKLKQISMIVSIVAAAFSAGRFLSPKHVEIKEVEKIVYKERETKEEDKKTKSRRLETISPDGTRTVEIIRETDKKFRSDSQVEIDAERSYEKRTSEQSKYSIAIYRNPSDYSAMVDRRILGGIFLGIQVSADTNLNNRKVGLGLRMEF